MEGLERIFLFLFFIKILNFIKNRFFLLKEKFDLFGIWLDMNYWIPMKTPTYLLITRVNNFPKHLYHSPPPPLLSLSLSFYQLTSKRRTRHRRHRYSSSAPPPAIWPLKSSPPSSRSLSLSHTNHNQQPNPQEHERRAFQQVHFLEIPNFFFLIFFENLCCAFWWIEFWNTGWWS